MSLPQKQAGIRCKASLVVCFVLALAVWGGHAEAAKPFYQRPDTAEPPKSLKDMMSDQDEDIVTPSGKIVKPATDAAPKIKPPVEEAKTPATTEETPKLIEAKKIPVAPEAAAPTQAYRIYNSPMLADDEQPARSGLDRMPPLDVSPDDLAAQDQGNKSPLLSGKDLHTAAEPATISNQFFPLLPLNAGAEVTPQLLPLATNHEMVADHSNTTRAIIFIHDMTRNASEGMSALMTLAGAENDQTLILAPQFPLGIDIARFAPHLPENGRTMLRWSLIDPLRSWQIGGDSVTGAKQAGISSFTVLDMMLMYLSDRATFPSLQQIVVVGHGMGADFVQRYAIIGQAPDLLQDQQITVQFLAANPNSFVYPTEARPVVGQTNFVTTEDAMCPAANDYPYGLEHMVPYARRAGANALRLRYPERRIMVLVSDKILQDNLLDDNCAAMAQGRTRLERARNFERYMATKFGENARGKQNFAVVPGGDYDPVVLFGSYCGMAVLFGDGDCRSTLLPHESMQAR